jgi:hypothetical protein
MPYHDWSDESFDWNALNGAAQYLEDNCRRWARLGIWTKEKWGTLRVSTTAAFATQYDFIYGLFHPGSVSYRWPRWFRIYIDWPVGKFLERIGALSLARRYQRRILKRFWNKAAEKWPHIKDEIMAEYRLHLDPEYWNDK